VAAAVLAGGGNAVDAALAGMCAATVVEPVLASLGGGGFLMAKMADGPAAGVPILYDFFTQTPGVQRPDREVQFFPVEADFGPARQEFHVGMGSIATPGVVKALFEVHRDLGRMPLRALVEPAARLARDGVTVRAEQAHIMRIVEPILTSTQASREAFASPVDPGRLVAQGERLRRPELGDFLQVLAIEGPALFYRGEVARAICAASADDGGHLRMEDFERYEVERRRPLVREALGARIVLNPPPSSGGLLIALCLALMEPDRAGWPAWGSAMHLLRLTAAMAATDRARREASSHTRPGGGLEAGLLTADLVARYRAEVLGRPPAHRGTTHISVIDRNGAAAALSLSNGEGSGYIAPGTGIVLNNMLGEADVNPDGFHRWRTDVRMSSMMAPTLAETRGGTLLALGSGGSNRIRSAILQVLLNVLAFGQEPEDAVAAPRLHLEDATLSIEPGYGEHALSALRAAFPELERWADRSVFFGGVHVAERKATGDVRGAGDPRRGGAAISA
jgi:gamma-glutamyltranspeptidase/glutathione hydrolase